MTCPRFVVMKNVQNVQQNCNSLHFHNYKLYLCIGRVELLRQWFPAGVHTQGCREEASGVPPNIDFSTFLLLRVPHNVFLAR
jgi:hypothetical protein